MNPHTHIQMAKQKEVYRELGQNRFEFNEKYEATDGTNTGQAILDVRIDLTDVRLSGDHERFGATLSNRYETVAVQERPGRGNISLIANGFTFDGGKRKKSSGTKLRHKAVKEAEKILVSRLDKRARREIGTYETKGGDPVDEIKLRHLWDVFCAECSEAIDSARKGELNAWSHAVRMWAALFPDLNVMDISWMHYLKFEKVRTGRDGLMDKEGRPVLSNGDVKEERELGPSADDYQYPAVYNKAGEWVNVPNLGEIPEGVGTLYDSNGNTMKRRTRVDGVKCYNGSGYAFIFTDLLYKRARYGCAADLSMPPRDTLLVSSVLSKLVDAKVISKNVILDDIASRDEFDANMRGGGEVASAERFRWVRHLADEIDPTGRMRYLMCRIWKHGHRVSTVVKEEPRDYADTRYGIEGLIGQMAKPTQKGDEDLKKMKASCAKVWPAAIYVAPHKSKEKYSRVVPLDDELIRERDRYLAKRAEHFPDSPWMLPSGDNPSTYMEADEARAMLWEIEYAVRDRVSEKGLDPDHVMPLVLNKKFHAYRRAWEVTRESGGWVNVKSSAYVANWTCNVTGTVQGDVYGKVVAELCLAAVEGISFAQALEKYDLARQATLDASLDTEWDPEEAMQRAAADAKRREEECGDGEGAAVA